MLCFNELHEAAQTALSVQRFDSPRARHFGTKLVTPKPEIFALERATSVRSNTLLAPTMRTSFAPTFHALSITQP
jgi:hypothetical protein